jgi:hypothetical protein
MHFGISTEYFLEFILVSYLIPFILLQIFKPQDPIFDTLKRLLNITRDPFPKIFDLISLTYFIALSIKQQAGDIKIDTYVPHDLHAGAA